MLLLFVPMTLTGTSGVAPADAGVAASLLNTGQQVGGAIGLAALGSVVWTVVADSIRRQTAQAVAAWHACLSAVRGHTGTGPARPPPRTASRPARSGAHPAVRTAAELAT